MKKLFLVMLMLLALTGLSYGAGFHGNNLFFTDSNGNTYTVTPPGSAVTVMGSSLATNKIDVANSVWGVSNGLKFEGATADAYEITIAPSDATADRTLTLPNYSGLLVAATSNTTISASTTISQDFNVGNVYTDTTNDNEDQTINATDGGTSGAMITIIFVSTSTGDEVITFGTNMHSTGTLTVSTTADRYYLVTFISNGTAWFEVARTAVQT